MCTFGTAIGGAKYLTALKGPLPQIEMIPTGGVCLANAAEFLAAGAFALGVGSDLVDARAIAAGKPEVVTESARKYPEIVREFRKNKAENSVLLFVIKKVAAFSPRLPCTPPHIHHNLPPRCTTKSSKTPAKTHLHHGRKSTEKSGKKNHRHGLGRVTQSSGWRIGKVRCSSGITVSGGSVFHRSAYSGRP
jgi:hypothetical protein